MFRDSESLASGRAGPNCRIGKASVMRRLGIPRLPLPQLVPSSVLARNCPGPADSFSPSPLPPPLDPSSLLRLYPLPNKFLCPFSVIPLCSYILSLFFSFERYWPSLSFSNESPWLLLTSDEFYRQSFVSVLNEDYCSTQDKLITNVRGWWTY